MSKSAIDRLEVDAQVQKRAQWEAFEFTLLGEGQVEVANHSYPDEEVWEHTYIVEVEGGYPVNCSCPYAEYHDGDCKHMAAVGIREPLIEAATASEDRRLAADGGTITSAAVSNKEPDTCPNGDPRCGGPDGEDLPCFDCYRVSSKES